MNTVLIYRPNNRKLIWIAFACSMTIHLGAIAIAGNRARPVTVTSWGEADDPVAGTDTQLVQVEEVSPPDEVPSPPNEDAFPQENLTPPTFRPPKRAPITPGRSTSVGTGRATNTGPVKALTLFAPKPNYPYEARRGGITGSGIAQLTVSSAAGNVVEARMAQRTGNAILDKATVEALRRWRFKPEVAGSVNVPVTFTLTGVSY
jgi:TonB family protein